MSREVCLKKKRSEDNEPEKGRAKVEDDEEGGRQDDEAGCRASAVRTPLHGCTTGGGEGDCGGGVILKAASLVVRQRSRVDAAADLNVTSLDPGILNPSCRIKNFLSQVEFAVR